MPLTPFSARIMPVKNEVYNAKGVQVDVLRLDEIHPVISGNKWFKLRPYLQDAAAKGKQAVLTFGGAYSNHILATAAACQLYGIQSIGIIRGEAPLRLSPTLAEAQQYGMQLFFTSRETYRRGIILDAVFERFAKEGIYVISEGGHGEKGMQGSMDILKSCPAQPYSHIIAAVGTGTMLSGIINSATDFTEVIGISVLKNNFSLQQDIQNLLYPQKTFRLLHDFHFGGYAKYTPALLQFMNEWFTDTGIPTDFVYTAKTFFAADQLIRNDFFSPGSAVLLVQSGGLQGNRSLPMTALCY
jgi:1-aminocyclopropane-1-carboxylate deaminase